MTTLFNVALELARVLTNVQESVTTGAGDATHLVDALRTERDGYWNGGTAFITSGAQAGKSVRVTGHVQSTGTMTIDATPLAVGIGQTYAVVDKDWPKYKLWEFINRAYYKLGELPAQNSTLTTVAHQESYTLPAGVYNVLRVEVASSLAAPYYYVQQYGTWWEDGGTIVFANNRWPMIDGYKIRITYAVPPAALDADADVINDQVHLYRLVWDAAVEAWNWRIQQSREDEPTYNQRLANAMLRSDREAKDHPIRLPQRVPKLSL